MFNKIPINQFKIKASKDDSCINPYNRLSNVIKIDKKLKKNKTTHLKSDNILGNFNKLQIYENTKNENNDIDSLNDTDYSSKSQKNNDVLKIQISRNSNHSSNSLFNMEEIDGSLEEKKKFISDDESEKINIEINKSNKKFLEKLKKNNIDFSNNMKNIFNNIGNVNPFKSEKNSDENKEEGELSLKFYEKSDNIRKEYYSKLLVKRVWIPLNDSQRHNNLIIFDWDDTLLPTSFLSSKNLIDTENKLNEKTQLKISKLEELVKNLLELSLSKGDVYIITNAGEGWVEDSTKKFYPNIRDILDKIEIISARKDYEKKYPNETKLWKIRAFLNLKKRLNDYLITNIVCLGDSVFEMDAGKILASNFIHAVIKTIKFMESPKPEELNKQLNLVLKQFNSIFSSFKNLTVRVEKKKK
jgi:hypothetical protein